jgi:outer membrane protein OmpA-like peptidoglycan-associated protein
MGSGTTMTDQGSTHVRAFGMKQIVTLVLIGSLALAGCADMNQSQQTTAQGAGIGAAAGAVIGAIAGGGKGAAIGAAAGAATGAAGGYFWNEHLEKQKQQMQQATAGTGAQVSQTADNRLKINVPSDAGFKTGSAQLNPKLLPALDQLAAGLQQNPSETVQVVGHTDNTGSDAVNNPLSQDRAQSVQSYLESRGVQAQRITTQGLGSQYPVAPNETAEGRAMNRRVEIFVAYPRS